MSSIHIFVYLVYLKYLLILRMENKPDPNRFLVYEELEDGSGFRLPDGNEFKYD